MMGGRPGNYSNVVIYDENKRYYYLAPQKNRPLTDDELRNFNISTLDQTRRSIQGVYGDVAAPLIKYSSSSSTESAFSVVSEGNPNDFIVRGGSSLEQPAILFVKGFYVFLTGDVRYQDQMFPSDNIDLATYPDKTKTLTSIPDLSSPLSNRIDIVYLDLHFEEVTASSGTEADIYRDSSLLDPRIGTASANRLRAVFDIRVKEGWSEDINKEIFTHHFFLGEIDNSVSPHEQHYKVPLAVIYRDAGTELISQDKVVDLLTLYDKRVMTLEEISYRSQHGGYGETSVFDANMNALGFTGIESQFPLATINEGAFSTGLNEGFGTEAFNSNSVTPRVVDNEGKYLLGALQVGVPTGIITYPIDSATGPEGLSDGEIVANQASLKSLYVGYELGVTGLREYTDRVNISARGLTGASLALLERGVTGVSAFTIRNDSGETGVYGAFIEALDMSGTPGNYLTIDYKGRLGYNTTEPAWDLLPEEWNADRYANAPNVVVDVNDSVRVRDNLFVDGDSYTYGGSYGKYWGIPGDLSSENKGHFGYTGVPYIGITGSKAIVFYNPGIATQGETGLVDSRGYVGKSGFYESFTADGVRLFTIGDIGEDYNRTVFSLYGTGTVPMIFSQYSLKYLPELGALEEEDDVFVNIAVVGGSNVIETIAVKEGLTPEIRIDKLAADLEFLLQTELSTPDIKVFVVSSPEEEALSSLSDSSRGHCKIIIRDKNGLLGQMVEFKVFRATVTEDVPWSNSHYYGSGKWGGSLRDITFAKLDLGEAADAWLFNGDVFFNGNGKLNRVTFSPNVVVRNDLFVYGSIYATSLRFNRAEVSFLDIGDTLTVNEKTHIRKGLTLGYSIGEGKSLLIQEQVKDPNTIALIEGNVKATNFEARDTSDLAIVLGNTLPEAYVSDPKVYLKVGGSMEDSSDPVGIHIIDTRVGTDITSGGGYKDLVLDFGNGTGSYGQLNVRVRGNLTATNSVASNNITAGQLDPVAGYSLYCKENVRVDGTLEVRDLRFTGEGTPGSLSDITQPQNAIYFQDSVKVDLNKPYGIVRDKDFAVDVTLRFNNQVYDTAQLDMQPNGDYTPAYEDICGIGTSITGPYSKVWNKDSLSYPEKLFVQSGVDTLFAEDFSGSEISASLKEYNRNSFGRVTVATLGTIKMKWSGRVDTSFNISSISDIIQEYKFDSPYFRDRQNNSVINWMPSENRSLDNNFMIHVQASVIDDSSSAPTIYSINRPLWVYLPLESWSAFWLYGDSQIYKTILVCNSYSKQPGQPNGYNTDEMTLFGPQADPSRLPWSASIYPRFKKIIKTQASGELNVFTYDAEWDADLILHTSNNISSSMLGKIYITKLS